MTQAATTRDHKTFGKEFLDDILEWIVSNYEPSDLYGDDRIREWVKGNMAMEDLFDNSDVEDYVKNYMTPRQRYTFLGMED